MKITFLNKGLGVVEVEYPCSIIDAIKISNPEVLASACAAIVDGELMDLRIKLAKDAAVEILDTESLAWMIEKYEGAFPTWLCPEQVRILPISEKFNDYAYQVKEELAKNGILVTVDDRAEKVGYKIRDVRRLKLPYALIVGQNEQENSLVSVWNRKDGDKDVSLLQAFIDIAKKTIESKSLQPL